MDFKRYWKAIIAAAGFVTVVVNEVAQAITVAGADQTLDQGDWITIVVTGVTAFGVWAKRNEPEDPNVS